MRAGRRHSPIGLQSTSRCINSIHMPCKTDLGCMDSIYMRRLQGVRHTITISRALLPTVSLSRDDHRQVVHTRTLTGHKRRCSAAVD